LRHDLNSSQVKSVVATCNQKLYLLAQLKTSSWCSYTPWLCIQSYRT